MNLRKQKAQVNLIDIGELQEVTNAIQKAEYALCQILPGLAWRFTAEETENDDVNDKILVILAHLKATYMILVDEIKARKKWATNSNGGKKGGIAGWKKKR